MIKGGYAKSKHIFYFTKSTTLRIKAKKPLGLEPNQMIKINGQRWMIYCTFKHNKREEWGADLYPIDKTSVVK